MSWMVEHHAWSLTDFSTALRVTNLNTNETKKCLSRLHWACHRSNHPRYIGQSPTQSIGHCALWMISSRWYTIRINNLISYREWFSNVRTTYLVWNWFAPIKSHGLREISLQKRFYRCIGDIYWSSRFISIFFLNILVWKNF